MLFLGVRRKLSSYRLPRCSTRSIILKKIPHKGRSLRGQVEFLFKINVNKKHLTINKMLNVNKFVNNVYIKYHYQIA